MSLLTKLMSCCKAKYINNKITNIEKYGVDNPFKSPEIKKQIKLTNLKKYGAEKWKEIEDARIKEAFHSGNYHRVVIYPGENYSETHQKSKPFYATEKPLWI